MVKFRAYITSFRLRTLPLSISGIILGSLLGYSKGMFDVRIFFLAIATTLSLQILSNLANEYGDISKGTDNAARLGPHRSIQSGLISIKEFKKLILAFVIISLIIGSVLLYYAHKNLYDYIIFMIIGALAILAAILYTVGRYAYGYHAMGDIFVLIFFGLVSVLGSFFLMTYSFDLWVLLPAISIGLLSVGVLNMNNIRDIENDKLCGKNTIPNILGKKNAKIYHIIIIAIAIISLIIYSLQNKHIYTISLVLLSPLYYVHIKNVIVKSGRDLDPELKRLSITTLLTSIIWGLGCCF